MSVLDADGRYVRVSDFYAQSLGCRPIELIGQSWRITVAPEDHPRVTQACRRMVDEGRAEIECRGVRRDGSHFEKHVILVRQVDEQGEHCGHYCFARDITNHVEETRSEQARRDRTTRQRNALAILALDQARTDGDLNRSLDHLTGVAAEALDVARASVWLLSEDGGELRCCSLFNKSSERHERGHVLSAVDYPAYFAAIQAESRIAADDARHDPRTHEFADGYLVPLDIHSMLDCGITLDGRLAGVMCFEQTGHRHRWQPEEEAFAATLAALCAQTMAQSDKARMAARMHASERRFSTLVNSAIDGIITIDGAGLIEDANPAAIRMFGYGRDELIGRNVSMLMPSPHAPQHDQYLRNYLTSGHAKIIGIGREVEGRRKDGSAVQIDLAVSQAEIDGQVRFTGILRDISERKLLKQQYMRAQKLDSIGRLAGGIAHDFNNLLSVIMAAGQMLRDELKLNADHAECVGDILETSDRARELVRQLMAFSRQQAMDLTHLNLSQLVERFEKFVRRALRENIRLDVRVPPSTLVVEGDSGQLEQVLMNLVLNAQDAMPEGGQLTIELAAGSATDSPPQAVLTIADTGTGMSEEVRAQIFEPFFTTKSLDAGSGLGLASAYGIISQHQGSIEVQSEPGQGSTFTVRLPLREQETAPKPTAANDDSDLDGTETILIAEDNEALRRIAVRSLQRKGYQVLTAAEGAEALDILERHEGPIDLLLTDVIMPGMSGKQLAETATERMPGLKLVYMSGYTDDIIDLRDHGNGRPHFIAKPFSRHDLLAKLRAVLDE